MSLHSDDHYKMVVERLHKISPMLPEPGDDVDVPETLRAYETALGEYEDILREAAQVDDPRLVKALLDAFPPDDAYGIAWAALHCVERYAPDVLYPEVTAALLGGPVGARRWASFILGRTRDERHLPSLLAASNDPDPRVRAEVALALGMIGSPKAIPTLERMTADPDPEVRGSSIGSIRQFRDAPVRSVVDRLRNDSSDGVRLELIWALRALGDPASCSVLAEMANDPHPGNRFEAIKAFVDMGCVDRAFLQAACSDHHFAVRREAARGLGLTGDPASRQTLEVLLSDPDQEVRDAAGVALRTLRG